MNFRIRIQRSSVYLFTSSQIMDPSYCIPEDSKSWKFIVIIGFDYLFFETDGLCMQTP